MKKAYINPAMEIVKISTQQMLAGSPKGISDETPKEWGARKFDFDLDED